MTKIFATIAIIAFIVSGCMFGSGSFRTGEPFQEKQIKQIAPGTTTKQQLLDWFGPPAAVARKGAVLKLPGSDSGKMDYQDVRADTFFELFSSKHALTDHHIVYYYLFTEVKSTQAVVVFAGKVDNQLKTDRLWILIDDDTGSVVDYIFRRAQ